MTGARESLAQALSELIPGVFESQHKEEEKNTNFCSKLDEVLRKVQRRDAALPKRQPGEKKKRNCRQPQATSQAGEYGQANRNAA